MPQEASAPNAQIPEHDAAAPPPWPVPQRPLTINLACWLIVAAGGLTLLWAAWSVTIGYGFSGGAALQIPAYFLVAHFIRQGSMVARLLATFMAFFSLFWLLTLDPLNVASVLAGVLGAGAAWLPSSSRYVAAVRAARYGMFGVAAQPERILPTALKSAAALAAYAAAALAAQAIGFAFWPNASPYDTAPMIPVPTLPDPASDSYVVQALFIATFWGAAGVYGLLALLLLRGNSGARLALTILVACSSVPLFFPPTIAILAVFLGWGAVFSVWLPSASRYVADVSALRRQYRLAKVRRWPSPAPAQAPVVPSQ